jgi:hypothetical protein
MYVDYYFTDTSIFSGQPYFVLDAPQEINKILDKAANTTILIYLYIFFIFSLI